MLLLDFPLSNKTHTHTHQTCKQFYFPTIIEKIEKKGSKPQKNSFCNSIKNAGETLFSTFFIWTAKEMETSRITQEWLQKVNFNRPSVHAIIVLVVRKSWSFAEKDHIF